MSDLGIFIFGCGVFGVALAATIASIIGTSQPVNGERDIPDNNAAQEEKMIREHGRRGVRIIAGPDSLSDARA